MRTFKIFFLASLIFAAYLTLPDGTIVSAALAEISVQPSLNVALVGETFNVTVDVGNVKDLFSWQVAMSFNPIILEAISVTMGEFLVTQPGGTYVPPPVLNNTHGWVGFGEVSLGQGPTSTGVDGSGTLATVTFRVRADGASFLNVTDPVPVSLTSNATSVLLDSTWPDPVEIPFTPVDGDFVVGAKPVVSFTYSPISPAIGETITFDASESYDPDGTIVSYEWEFGDESNDTGVIVQHSFVTGGTYSVTLTVTDNSTFALESILTRDVLIRFGNDVAVMKVTASPTTVRSGETVSISVEAMNQGTEVATFDVTVYYSLPISGAEEQVAGTLTFADHQPGSNVTLTLDWDTSGVDEGDYRIKAVAATVEGETDTADNTFIDGTVTIESSSGGFPIEYAIVGVAAAAIVIAVIFLYFRRKGP